MIYSHEAFQGSRDRRQRLRRRRDHPPAPRHPDVELVRVASVDYVGEPLSAAHPNLEGPPTSGSRSCSAAEAAAGIDVVLLGLPHKVSATSARAHRHRRAHRRHVGRLPPARCRGSTRVSTAPAPAPHCSRRFVYGLPELNRESHPPGAPRRLAGLLRDHHRARPPAARARGAPRRAPSRPSASPARPARASRRSAGTHHPVRASNLRTYKPLEHQHVPEIAETLAPAGRADVALRSCRCRRRSRAASSPPASRSVAGIGDAGAHPRRSTRGTTRASRSCACPEAPARGRRGGRLELRRGRLRSRPGRAAASAWSAVLGDRQPHQGRRRPGDPDDEPHARARRAGSRSRTSGRGRDA